MSNKVYEIRNKIYKLLSAQMNEEIKCLMHEVSCLPGLLTEPYQASHTGPGGMHLN
jgi:hypothetical protein